jgi:phage terminase Nu1 subunit (DNA packaging protein)
MSRVTGNKAQLAEALGVALPTLSAWIIKYRPEFPIQSVGSNGRSYVFDFPAVFDFLRAKKDEQEASRAERDQALAQLVLPLGLVEPEPAPTLSIKDQVLAVELRRRLREEAEKAGRLISADEIGAAVSAVLARLNRDTRAFIQQLGREQDWPTGYTQSVLTRFGDTQRSAVAALKTEFTATDTADVRRQA